jgi:hypothetical protein
MFSAHESKLKEISTEGRDIEAIQKALQQFDSDGQYVQEHLAELLSRYPDMWIAVYNQEIIGAAKTVQGLVKQVQKKGLSLADIYREYLSREDDIWILVACNQLSVVTSGVLQTDGGHS